MSCRAGRAQRVADRDGPFVAIRQLIVADEPTTALDVVSQVFNVIAVLAERGRQPT